MDFSSIFSAIDSVLRGHVDVPLNERKGSIVTAIKGSRGSGGGKLKSVSKILNRASRIGPNNVGVLLRGVLQDTLNCRLEIVRVGFDVDGTLDFTSTSRSDRRPVERPRSA